MVVHEQDPYNAEPPLDGLTQPITALDSFYVRNHGPVPDIDASGWTLTVDGLVDEPLRLSLAQLQTRWQPHTVTATMQCAGNRRAGFLPVRDIPGEAAWGPGATSTATWTGARLGDVLRSAGVQRDARFVALSAPDVSQLADPPQAFGGSVGIDKATSDEVLLAWSMNGGPLPPVHGGPVRLVVPGYIGARSVKWLQRVTLQSEPSDNYFQTTAYRLLTADEDPDNVHPGVGMPLSAVALNADITSPDGTEAVAAGPVDICGYAYAGDDRLVTRVDVSCDEGRTWVPADLAEPPSPWVWQHWRAVVQLAPGEHTVVARAWDSTGASQPESPRHLWNPKGYINNSWARRRIQAVAAGGATPS